MKKNFFKKKLASGLAIALVVASISVPNYASAASATKVVKQGGATAPTVLYVGGSKVDFGLSKTYSGNTYTWTTSDSSIATINKSGVVTGVAPGTVTIKCTARDSKGKWLAAFTQKLTIKLRATSVDAGSDDFSLYIDETKDLNAVKTPSNSTDAVRYYSDNTEVATVDAKTGVVTAVGVGTATISVYSKATWASATDSKYNKTDSVTVTVVDGITAVKQTVADEVELTFASDQSEKLTSSNLTITDADGVKQTISDIDFSSDGKTATVTTYLQFEDGAVYTLTYGDSSKTFTASNGDVASVALESDTVQYDTITDLTYYAYDKNGIDVSENVDWESDVDFDYDESDAEIDWNLDDDDDDVWQIETYDYPDTIDVEMTYSYYDSDESETVEYTAKATIKSVEEITNTATDIQYTLADETDYEDIDWDDDTVTTLSADDTGYQLFITAENQDGDDIYEWNFESFESTDEDVLTVSYDEDEADTEGTPVYVYPVDEGTAYIKATYGDTTKLLKVTVGSEAEAKSITVDDSAIELYSPFIGSSNAVTVDVDLLDQYGDEIDADDYDDDLEVEPVDDDADAIIATSVSDDEVSFYLATDNETDITSSNDGSYVYKLTANDKTVKVTVKVIDVDMTNTEVDSIEIASSDADNAVDVALDADDYDDDDDTIADVYTAVDYTVYALNDDGDRVAIVDPSDVSFTIYQDGDALDDDEFADEGFNFDTDSSASKAALELITYSDNVISQASVATYKLKASYDGETATKTLKVTNSQPELKVTKDEATVSSDDVDDITSLLDEAFTIKYDGDTIDVTTDLVDATVVIGSSSVDLGDSDDDIDAGDSVRVKSVTIRYEIVDGYYIEVSADVNQTVKVTD